MPFFLIILCYTFIIDTVNMLIGLLNANGARKYILAKDTTDKDITINFAEKDINKMCKELI